MKKMLLLAAAAALTAAPAALAQSSNTAQEIPATASQPTIEIDTATFIKMVASSNAFYIESSKLAEKSSNSDAVKKFAQQMITDHTKAGVDSGRAGKRGDHLFRVESGAPAQGTTGAR